MAKVPPNTAEPTWPNAGVEAWYRGTLQAIVLTMAKDMLVAIRVAWREGGGIAHDAKKMAPSPANLYRNPQIAAAMGPKPSTPKLLDISLKKWGVKWNKRLDKMSESIAKDFAMKNKKATESAMKAKMAKAGFTVKFKPTETATATLDAVIAENVGLIRSIPQKFHTDVQAAVWQAVMSGSDLSGITKQIHEKYGVAWKRAALIARDQNAKAKAAIEKGRRLEIGIKKAYWMHSHAGKVPRPTHVENDGKEYDVETGWFDPAVQQYVWPGTLIECKCSDRPVIPGFE